jgi:predicted RNase H-like nuclease
VKGPGVVGVDRYGRGWVAVRLVPGSGAADSFVGAELGELVRRVPDAACIAVDMPIGLPESERAADALARRFVGPRWPSVFATPPAEVLAAASYEEANEIAARLLGGKRISQQAWALRRTIAEVAEVAAADERVIEVHPEVSFRAMAGEPLAYAKTTWNGQAARRRALARAGIELPEELGEAGAVPVADVLDAAAAAWSARRYAEGRAASLPEGAGVGERQVIWY